MHSVRGAACCWRRLTRPTSSWAPVISMPIRRTARRFLPICLNTSSQYRASERSRCAISIHARSSCARCGSARGSGAEALHRSRGAATLRSPGLRGTRLPAECGLTHDETCSIAHWRRRLTGRGLVLRLAAYNRPTTSCAHCWSAARWGAVGDERERLPHSKTTFPKST